MRRSFKDLDGEHTPKGAESSRRPPRPPHGVHACLSKAPVAAVRNSMAAPAPAASFAAVPAGPPRQFTRAMCAR
eukprot:349914-Chlamydomonas_euryale.AAC.2